jgi:hypothetical protein
VSTPTVSQSAGAPSAEKPMAVRKPRPRSDRRKVPKETEMAGKAAQLIKLIEDQEQNDTGRSLEDMLRDDKVRVPKETFYSSRHFEDPRKCWTRLQQSREAVQHTEPGTGATKTYLTCRSCKERFAQYMCPRCEKTPDQCMECHAEEWHRDLKWEN